MYMCRCSLLIKGGHLNPAVSLAMMIVGKLKVRQLPVYWLAQYLGAFAASATVYVVYSGRYQFIMHVLHICVVAI